jgi:hypothetical protein
MSGFVRKALLGVTSLLAASVVYADVPDCTKSTMRPRDTAGRYWLNVVGHRVSGAADAAGLTCVTVRDFSNNGIANIRVEADFSDCCDVNLCSDAVAGQTVTCSPPIISGFSDAAGLFCFIAMGAAKDNGVYVQPNIPNGASTPCVNIRLGTASCFTARAVVFDQSGVAPSGAAPGVDAIEISIVRSAVKANNLGGPSKYRARDDLFPSTVSASGGGDLVVDAGDISGIRDQVKRANVDPAVVGAWPAGSSKNPCVAAYCLTKVPGPNCP